MTQNKTLPILNLLSFIIMIAINIMAMFNLIGYSTKEISDSIPTLLMPIGITFSIVWTIIYVFLAIYTIYQLISKKDGFIKDISVYYLFSNLLNVLWIISFHAKMYLVSTIVILILLIDLYLIVSRLRFGFTIPKVTFSIYFAWISVASVVSIFSYISSINPSNYNSWFMRMLTVMTLVLLTALTFIRSKDYPYVITIIVAMIGIMLKHVIDFKGSYTEIIVVSIISLIMLITVTVVNIMGPAKNKLLKGSE